MRKGLLSLVFLAAGSIVSSAVLAEEGQSWPNAGTDINDIQSLQRGARNFMSYCSGCHSMSYLRYNRLAKDLQIPEPQLKADLMFTTGNPFDHIVAAMPTDAQTWFGKQPPDLTLMARERGVNYIYAYLKDYYLDPKRPWGVNNMVLPGTAMPAVLSSLQGLQKAVFTEEKDAEGHVTQVVSGVELMSPGSLKPEEYDQFIRDVTNFLDYAAEPAKAKRQSMGVFVILFLLVFFAFAFLLKKEYWKDVH